MRIKISTGNMKMGAVPSISLPPIISCRDDAPCTKQCYAMKAHRMYPAVRKAWAANLEFAQEEPWAYFEEIRCWVAKKKPERFRFHVAGDLLDYGYLLSVDVLAGNSPETNFLAFTKRYELVDEYLDKWGSFSDNLSIILSAWPGLELVNPHGLPVAWMQDGTETRVPADAVPCAGHCENYSSCWDVKHDVVFNLH